MTYNQLTITVGGSYCEDTKAAAYSFSIRKGERKIYHTGYFTTHIHSVHDAVISGVGNALFYLFNRTDIVDAGKLHINIDSSICRKVLLNEEIKGTSRYIQKVNAFRESSERAISYVKRVLGNHAHGFTIHCIDGRKKSTAGEWCIHYCTKHAKTAMKNQRNTIKHGKNLFKFEENL